MQEIQLCMPEYVEKELKARNIDASKCLVAILLDNETVVELFSKVAQSEDGMIMLEDGRNSGNCEFCLDADNSFIFGAAKFEHGSIFDVTAVSFGKPLQDDRNAIMNLVISGKLWTLNFKYNSATNEVFGMQVNWDIILKADLESMVDEFIHKQNNNLH